MWLVAVAIPTSWWLASPAESAAAVVCVGLFVVVCRAAELVVQPRGQPASGVFDGVIDFEITAGATAVNFALTASDDYRGHDLDRDMTAFVDDLADVFASRSHQSQKALGQQRPHERDVDFAHARYIALLITQTMTEATVLTVNHTARPRWYKICAGCPGGR